MNNVTLLVSTTMGLESVLSHELKQLGYTDLTVKNGFIEFEAPLIAICRCNLWLRTAGRIYLKIGQFMATTFDELYESINALPWHHYIGPNDEFPISKISSRKSELFSKSDCQRITKKAIVDCLTSHHNVQSLPETDALFPIRLQIENDDVICSIDTTGSGLSNRGYRAAMGQAPLRETLAAGLILLSRWRPDLEPLMDPFCGSGTILIEAAMIAQHIAPGLKRRFISDDWDIIPKSLWDEACNEAEESIKPLSATIIGSDNHWKACKLARENCERADISGIHIQEHDAASIRSSHNKGHIVTNPPYGERLSEQDEAAQLYRDSGNHWQQYLKHWSYYVISAHPEFETSFGLKADKNRKLFNGGMQCYFYSYNNFKK